MVQRGREFIFGNLLWDSTAEKVEGIYDSCIEKQDDRS